MAGDRTRARGGSRGTGGGRLGVRRQQSRPVVSRRTAATQRPPPSPPPQQAHRQTSDRNGPWLSERLREIGVDAAMIQIVGDRPEDLLAALRYMSDQGMAVVVTSGGLGPTADDLTAEVVGRFAGREMVLDARLEERIAEIIKPLMRRWPGLDQDAIRESNRRPALMPRGGSALEPVGTAPGPVGPPED